MVRLLGLVILTIGLCLLLLAADATKLATDQTDLVLQTALVATAGIVSIFSISLIYDGVVKMLTGQVE